MLTHIVIQNFALVDRLELEFDPGMTVISGETGAGKSIILDALGLALGDRADVDMIREGEDRAEIAANFTITHIPEASQWLSEHDFEAAQECLIRRVITRDSRSRSYMNGQPVTQTQLRDLGQYVMDIHGQHEHQRLLKKEHHRVLLDAFAQQAALVDALKHAYNHWKKHHQRLRQLSEESAEKTAHIQLLSYQLEELLQLNLFPDEVQQLEEEQTLLNNADSLLQAGYQLLQMTRDSDEVNCVGLLTHCQNLLQKTTVNNATLQQVAELLSHAQIQIEEASSEMRHYLDNVDMNPERLNEVEERLTSIYDIARKHRVLPEELLALQERLQGELEQIQVSEEALSTLQATEQHARQLFMQQARELSKARQAYSTQLASAVDEQLHNLGMPQARFYVHLEPLEESRWNAQGCEEVEFRIATNPGQSAKPLAKIASGGELSRISLAIQVVTAKTASKSTLIFDEVDVGIGGGVAEVVGAMLRELSEETQIFCVTHQPQVASQAHQHLFVSKQIEHDTTRSSIAVLSAQARLQEVARMLGGVEMTETTLNHAQEMLNRAGSSVTT